MCVKLRGSNLTPGQIAMFLTKVGKASGVWGFRDGKQYNARVESLPNVWKDISMNRGILQADCFWEKNKKIVRSDGKLFQIGVIFNPQMEFAVVTVPAAGVVKPIHPRMPACIDETSIDLFFNGMTVTIAPELMAVA